jgi:PAS domain-containing protein
MVYTHDLTGRITSINKAGEQLLGRPRADIQQRNLVAFISEAKRPAARQWVAGI